MWRRALLAAVIVAAGTLAAVAQEDHKAARREVYPHQFPPGPGKGLADRTCLMCHGAMLVTQQHKDSAAWERTFAQMEKWGARLTASERDTLRTYLLTHFGPGESR